MLVIALLMFTGLGQPFNRPQAFRADAGNYSSPFQSSSTTVEVTFDGLMVFEKVGRRYEVGILDATIAPFHELRIKFGKTDLKPEIIAKLINSKSHWNFEVIDSSNQSISSDIKARHKKDCKRLQDTTASEDLEHVFDFCWIMDLEREFHGDKPVPLKPGLLRPIIWLNNGELYTKFKYDELERQQKSANLQLKPIWDVRSSLGFVAETIALRVDLREGERLALKVDGMEVFSLKQNGERNAGIFYGPLLKNRPRGRRAMQTDSHFIHYYALSDDFATGEKVDIRPKEEERLRPLNRWFLPEREFRLFDDEARMATFDDQACGGIFFGKSSSGFGEPGSPPSKSGRRSR